MRATILTLGLAMIALPSAACEEAEAVEVPPDRRQALLMIHGLSSSSQAQKVRSQLRKTSGVTGVVMDLPNAEALVSYDANLANEHGLQEAVEAAGFGSHLGDLEGP